MMEKVAKGVDDVGFTELALDESHDAREVHFAGILAIIYLGGSHGESWKTRRNATGRVHVTWT